jgi:archaellum biogenesis ATPase FlaH
MYSKQSDNTPTPAQERKQQRETYNTFADDMRKRGASERSIRIALAGLKEYFETMSPTRSDSPSTSHSSSTPPGLFVSDVATRPVDWLWQDRIPLGAITLLEGLSGSGKSLLALHIAACVSSGRVMPDGTSGAQGNVVLISSQDHSSYTIKPCLVAAGGDPSHVLLLNTVEHLDTGKAKFDERPFSLTRDLCFLEEAITRINAVLAIIDSLDTCRFGELRKILPTLAQLAQRTGCAILLICPLRQTHIHTASIRSTGPLDLLVAVRSILLTTPTLNAQQQRRLVTTKHAFCAEPATLGYQIITHDQGIPTIHWLGEYDKSTSSYVDPDPPLSSIRQAILATLQASATPMDAATLAKATGQNYENMRKTVHSRNLRGALDFPRSSVSLRQRGKESIRSTRGIIQRPPAEYWDVQLILPRCEQDQEQLPCSEKMQRASLVNSTAAIWGTL